MHHAFKALGDPHRLEIVRLALRAPRHVQELADRLGISQPAVSRHVALLERAGLVLVTRSGRRSEITAPPPDAPALVRHLMAMIAPGEPAREAARSTKAPVARRHPARGELDDYLL